MPKRRFPGCLVVLCVTALLLVGGYLTLKHGYCRSWWGKGSLVMRSLWLCDCSREFEQALYPATTEVFYSACEVNKPIEIRSKYGPLIGRDVQTPGVLA